MFNLPSEGLARTMLRPGQFEFTNTAFTVHFRHKYWDRTQKTSPFLEVPGILLLNP